MAATMTGSGELTYVSFPIDKTEKTPDGDIIVYGKATDGSVDSDEQIVDPDFSAKAIQDWLATGANVRVQHNAQRDPAGVGIEANTDSDGTTWVKSLVVEPVAKTLVEKKALRAYSVGIARPRIVRDAVARGGRIVDGEIVEISLVDRPANKNCGIQLVKAADDGHAEWVGKMFGSSPLLAKAASDEEDEVVSLDLPKGASVSFSPADLKKLMDFKLGLVEKRQMDPDVGGGVDRDKIPAADFAGRDRSFPIVTPGDVSDAASSIGRAGADNFSPAQLRQNIIRIARRKGDSFVAELPESWKKEMGNSEKADKPPFEGAKPAFDSDENDKKSDEAKPDTTKGDDDTDAGSGSDPDDDNSGALFGDGNDDGDNDPDTADKSATMKCMKCEGAMGASHAFCPNCGAAAKSQATKSDDGDRKCPKCGAEVEGDHSFCPSCGSPVKRPQGSFKKNAKKSKSVPHSTAVTEGLDSPSPANHGVDEPAKPTNNTPELDSDVKDEDGKKKPKGSKKSKKANVKKSSVGQAAGAVGEAAASTKPVPSHREPDGPYIEALEHDSGMPTTPDTEMAVAKRFKEVGVPTDLGIIHDLTCPAYHPVHADKAHPLSGGLTGAVDVQAWLSKANDAAFSGTMDEATRMSQLWQHAATIKNASPQTLAEVRIEAHKNFKDANPGPSNFPKPTELSAGKFNRPYLSAGRAANSPGAMGANTASIPSGSLAASQFTQGFQQAGRAADSPSNKNHQNEVIGYPSVTGQVQQVDYTEAQKNMVRSAMAAMHDHVEHTFPGICPMAAPGLQGQKPEGARPVADGVRKSASKEKLAKKVAKGRMSVEEAMALLQQTDKEPEVVTKAASVVDSDVVKTAVLEATSELRGMFAAEISKNSKMAKQLKKLQGTVESLGEMADPSVAAFRGVAQPAFKSRSAEPYAATVAQTAEQTQLLMMRELEKQVRTSPDPVQREAAWNALVKMRGL